MNPSNGSGSEFSSPLSSDNLLHGMIKGIIRSIEKTDAKLDKITEDVAEIRSTVDKLGIDHIFSDIKRLETVTDNHDKRILRVENYHNRILGVVAVIGFMLAVASIAVNLLR